jgi:glycosyltransferase involved in cell wall biosynthesis
VTFDPKTVFVLIPAYRESKVIAQTIAPLATAGYRIVVIDDGSPDDTESALRGLPVEYLRHSINLGTGAARQTGMTYAQREGAEYAVHFDADGQHDASEIPKMLEPLMAGRADVTLGTRFQRKEDICEIPTVRRIVLRGAILVNAVMTGVRLSDAHNGFRAFNRTALSKIRLTENRMAYASELLTIIRREKLRVEEVPVHIVYTDYSTTKGQRNMNAIHILIDLILNRLF